MNVLLQSGMRLKREERKKTDFEPSGIACLPETSNIQNKKYRNEK